MKNGLFLKTIKFWVVTGIVATLFLVGNLQAQEQIIQETNKLTLRSNPNSSYFDPSITLDGTRERRFLSITTGERYDGSLYIHSSGRADFRASSLINLVSQKVKVESPTIILVNDEAFINGYGTVKVGIGTETPDETLTVNGRVRAKGVKVDLIGWPDYVFKNTYNLPTLAQVETFIKNNGHLSAIPSAADVEKNGIELGEMNKLLLQKIEELTLYTIDQEKQLNQQKVSNQQLKMVLEKVQDTNEELETRLAKLEALLTKK